MEPFLKILDTLRKGAVPHFVCNGLEKTGTAGLSPLVFRIVALCIRVGVGTRVTLGRRHRPLGAGGVTLGALVGGVVDICGSVRLGTGVVLG